MALFFISFFSWISLIIALLFTFSLPIFYVLLGCALLLFAVNVYLLLGLIFSIDCRSHIARGAFRWIFFVVCITFVVGMAMKIEVPPQLIASLISLHISGLLFIGAHHYFSGLQQSPNRAIRLLAKMLFIVFSAAVASSPFFFSLGQFAGQNTNTPRSPQTF